MQQIDLNCDMGESPEAIADGTQEALLRSITSANIACGGHAGDAQTMRTTIKQAIRAGVAIGAHPGYPDQANFGRLELNMPLEALTASVCEQVRALAEIAAACGARLIHVKPHGALYNQAVKNRDLAAVIAEGVTDALGTGISTAGSVSDTTAASGSDTGDAAAPPILLLGKSNRGARTKEPGTRKTEHDIILVGLAGSPMLDVFRHASFPVAAEAFADRRYEPDGTLRSRKFDNALIHDPAEAARQAVSIAQHGSVTAHDGTVVKLTAQTICIHGDTPGAPQIAAAVAQALRAAGVGVHSL